jgi:hypothetical protein
MRFGVTVGLVPQRFKLTSSSESLKGMERKKKRHTSSQV